MMVAYIYKYRNNINIKSMIDSIIFVFRLMLKIN